MIEFDEWYEQLYPRLHAAMRISCRSSDQADDIVDLPDRMRQVVVLRHVGDLTEPDIAAVLGISRGTVSSTLRDAHARIRTRLHDENDEGLT